jgi:hypothetical protein
VWAEYFVTGPDIDPDQLTLESGLEPSRVMRRGVPLGPAGNPPKLTAWCIDAERLNQEGIHEVLDDLMRRLRPAWPILVEFGRTYDVHVVVSIEPTDRMPSLFVDRSVIQGLAELGAWLDIGVSADIEVHSPSDLS